MKRSRFTEEQVIGILREQFTGMWTAEVCRRDGISEQTFCRRKPKYGATEASNSWRPKGLKEANPRLQKLLQESMLEVRYGGRRRRTVLESAARGILTRWTSREDGSVSATPCNVERVFS